MCGVGQRIPGDALYHRGQPGGLHRKCRNPSSVCPPRCESSAGELIGVTCLSPGHHRPGCGVGGGAGPVDGDDPGVGESVSVAVHLTGLVETSGS